MKAIINESASEAIVLDSLNLSTIASQVSLNIKGEWDAIEGYNKLIPFFEATDDQESIDHIREIISDEKNHAELLRGILLKYDGNIPTAED